jgi:phytoene dehydrogenase-like protein
MAPPEMAVTRDEYDGIIVGAGHNGLILQAYLCRAGLRVLALERLDRPGGGVERIVVEGGRAVGVDLAGGERIRARGFVAAALNPHQLLDLVGPGHLPAEVERRARAFRYNVVGPLFGVNVALREAPRYRAADVCPDLQRAGLTILGLDGPDEIYELYKGRLPTLGSIWGTTPTAHDPSQAPAGVATALMWQKVPYALNGDAGNWDARKSSHAARVLARWREFAPNLTRDTVLTLRALTPLDTERGFPNLRGGDLGVGWAGQQRDQRPFPGAGRYALPVRALYLCGGATHPGGNITGLPGYNAARVIAEDLGLRPWWAPDDLEHRWRALD